MKPEIACLFWHYKSPDICENRLRLLRHYNPNIRIYALYGGNPLDADFFEERLSPWLDDFYAFKQDRTSHWKWFHGDQMLVDWFQHRGFNLAWDTIFIAQWDMLVFDQIDNLFASINKGEILLSGLRQIKDVKPWWHYTRPNSPELAEFDHFMAYVQNTYNYKDEPLCCQFIVACLPRSFMERYMSIAQPDLGFLEYKIPIFAQIFSTPFCTNHAHNPWWGDAPKSHRTPLLLRTLNAESESVPLSVIETHRLWPQGRRIFHPVFNIYPLKLLDRIWRIFQNMILFRSD